MPSRVKLGAVSSKKDKQQHGHGGGRNVKRDSHRRQIKPEAWKRFDARQGSAASLAPNASDFFRHLFPYACAVSRMQLTGGEQSWSEAVRPAPLRGQQEHLPPDHEPVRGRLVPKHNALRGL